MGLLTDLASLRPLLAAARFRLAQAKMHLGEYKGAYTRAQGAFALAQRIALRYRVALARLVLGHLSLVDAAHAKALEQIDDRLDESLTFHMRLDKQKAYEGELSLWESGEAVKIRIKPATFPASREGALEILLKLREK